MRGLLLIVLSLLFSSPHFSAAQENLDCTWAGTWLISYTIIQEWNNPQGGGLAVALATETGAATVEAVCSGSAPTLSGEATGQLAVFDVQGQQCGAEYTAALSGTMDVSAEFPIFNLHFDTTTGSSVCYMQEVATQATGRTVRLITSSIDDGHVYDGDAGSIAYDDPQSAAAVSGFLDIGGTIEIDYFIDAYRSPSPEILEGSSRFRRYFLQTVPLLNRFSATVDWDYSPEPSATFRIHEDEPQPMVVEDDEIYFDIPVGAIQQTGEVAARVILTTGVDYYGMTRRTRRLTPEQVGIVIVPMPSWATNSGLTFQPEAQESHVIYRATKGIPETPLETPIVEIPDFVPYVGGKWGLSPVQMIVNVGATSLGGPQTENIGGTGTFYFAGEEYDLVFDGSFSTDMNTTTQQLEVIESPFTIELSDPVTFTRSLPLLAVVPPVAALYAVPYIGDLVAALSSFASIRAQITADVSGQGRLGITLNNELGITSGSLNYQLGGTVATTASLYIAWLQISGSITGNVEMALAPQPTITDCNLIMGFTLTGGVFGGSTFTLPEFTQVPLCD